MVELTPPGAGQAVLTAADGLGSPRGLAIEPFTGDLFVADAAEQRIWRWDPAAGLSTFADASDGKSNPEGVAFDAAGNLFVSNAANATASVLRFDPGGNGTTILSLADGLGSPRGLAIDPASGDLFIADALAQRVFRWNPSAGISNFADAADAIGNPEGLAFDAAGSLFVSNAANATASVLRLQPSPPAPIAQRGFWDALQALCGHAYAGTLRTSDPADADLAGQPMMMHVRVCNEQIVQIPFHVGENRSRVWVLMRTEDGLRLKHHHHHEDGTPDEVTFYGGNSDGTGTATEQRFPADEHSRELFLRTERPQAVENVWSLELVPGERFSYALRRPGRHFQVDFDLRRAVPAPPPPWGW